MKKILFVALFACVGFVFTGCEPTSTPSEPSYADYYWYKDNKIFLERGSQEYIIYDDALLSELDKKKLTDTDNVSPSYPENPHLKWGITQPYATIEDNEHVLYRTPSYKIDEEGDLFVTHEFLVKLKDSTDLPILQDMAEQYNAEIVRESLLPLWYLLRCGLPSSFNAMELANIFYESGLFSVAEPNFMGGIRLDAPTATNSTNHHQLKTTPKTPHNEILMIENIARPTW